MRRKTWWLNLAALIAGLALVAGCAVAAFLTTYKIYNETVAQENADGEQLCVVCVIFPLFFTWDHSLQPLMIS
jgi:hypothetical protein